MEFTPQTTTQALVDKVLRASAGGAISKRAGYSYINGSLIPNTISAIPARAIRAGRIVRAGIGMTEKFTANIDPRQVNSVTVQLQTNVGVRARTLKGNSGTGTPGNDGLINLNPKIIPSTSPFEIPLRQIEDQPFFFPQMQLETMLYDETVETISNYIDNTANGMDSYHMAKALSYSMLRGAQNIKTGSKTDPLNYPNIVTIDEAKINDDNYMIGIVNKINSLMANGDKETQLMTFTGPREIACRPELVGWLKTPKTGFITNSDIATRLLYEPNFDINLAERYGSQNRGSIQGFEMQEAPQGIWSLVEKWLNLAEGDLDKIYGIIFTPLAYAAGGVGKKEMKMLQSTEHDGVVSFPYIKYGGAAYRILYVLASESWSIPTALQNDKYATPVAAPADWYPGGLEPIEKVIYDTGGNAIGVDIIANVLKPNGNNATTEVTLTVLGTSNAAITNANIAVTYEEVAVPVTNFADGTYVFGVPKGSTPSVTITASGYTSQTFALTKANTKGDSLAVSKTLVATV